MKVVHHDKEFRTAKDWLTLAKNYEEDGELAKAAAAYEKALKTRKLEEKIYNRLMILYRKLKDSKSELKIINAGIAAFEESYHKNHKAPGKKITHLSNALLKATGLAGKKGENIYQPGPVGRWKKRKRTLLSRLKK